MHLSRRLEVCMGLVSSGVELPHDITQRVDVSR